VPASAGVPWSERAGPGVHVAGRGAVSRASSRASPAAAKPVRAPPVLAKPVSRARVARIRARLAEVYGVPVQSPHGHPIAELVLTVLSQSTNDRNRDVAYLRLRERFHDWHAVRDAPLEEIEEAIRPGGISKVKSARIQAILRAIGEPLDLDWIEHAPVAESRAFLCALPGVGRKTAACVLLFTFGLRDVPVDTHVSRVGARLHLLRAGAPSHEQHDAMLALTPPGAELELHINLLRHGRRICQAQRPACDACALARMCPSRDEFRRVARS
jgi:endonuclease-3